jgi:uncharacterized membrane protein YesL
VRILAVAFARAVADWWYGLIPFAILNFAWFAGVLTVIAGPPATAALLVVARDAAMGVGAEPSTFFAAFRQFFWRSWGLGLITAAGTLFLGYDFVFYMSLLADNALALGAGLSFFGFLLLLWGAVLLVAWPLLVNQPAMPLRAVLYNALLCTLQAPFAAGGLLILVLLLLLFALAVAFLLPLVLGAFVALLAQHYLHLRAPILAAWPPGPGDHREASLPG